MILFITYMDGYTHHYTMLSGTGNSGLQVVVLPSNTVLCLLDGQPAVGCLIRYGNDSSYNNLTNIGRSVATGLTVLTSNLTGDTTYYSVSITTGHLSIELHGSFNTCTIRDLMVINITVQPQSSCSDPTGEVAQACYSGVTPGSTVLYRCATSSFVILFGQSLRTCQSDGIWDGTTPSCVCNGEQYLYQCPIVYLSFVHYHFVCSTLNVLLCLA